MPNEAPGWQAHRASGYDGAMTALCDRLLADIVADPGRRQAIVTDPRDLHRELFAGFTPAAYPEFAGTYRGTPARRWPVCGCPPTVRSSPGRSTNSARLTKCPGS